MSCQETAVFLDLAVVLEFFINVYITLTKIKCHFKKEMVINDFILTPFFPLKKKKKLWYAKLPSFKDI